MRRLSLLLLLVPWTLGAQSLSVFPGERWERVRGPALKELGWSDTGLQEVFTFLDRTSGREVARDDP